LEFRYLAADLAKRKGGDYLGRHRRWPNTRWLLSWIPLMQGGDESSIMEQWKQIALTEPDAQIRSTLGSFALLFAELAGRLERWQQALEGWDMRTSQVVERWREEGRQEGRKEGSIETMRELVLALLEKRFGAVSAELVQRVQATNDMARLKAAHQQVLDLHSPDDLVL
jgi:hypothetical protein